jgi:hypothetical protein
VIRRDEQIEADQAVVITIAILNSSSAAVVLVSGLLTGGAWRGDPPVPGTPITTGPTTFLNAGSVFGPVGGYMTLTPAGGGSISLSWNRPPGGSLQAYGNVSGTSALSLSYQATNVSTFQPTVTYLITDPGGDVK